MLIFYFYFHVHPYMHVAPEVDLDIGCPDFFEVVSFWEEDVFFLEFNSMKFFDFHDDFMFADPPEDLISTSNKLKSQGCIMKFLRDLMSRAYEMTSIILHLLLLFFFSLNKIRCCKTSKFLGDEIIPRIGMTYLDDLTLFPNISNALQELYRNFIIRHSLWDLRIELIKNFEK